MHGFNRLGGNSLAETVVAGRYVGQRIVEFLQGASVNFKHSATRDAFNLVNGKISKLANATRGESAVTLRNEMQEIMMDHVGIFRDGKNLQAAVTKLEELLERSQNIALKGSTVGFNPEVSLALRIPGMIKLAQCTAYGALKRTESRGAHTREDFPERNDKEWLNRTLAHWKEGDSLPVLSYEEASPYYEIAPGERGYGGGSIIPAELPEEKLRVPSEKTKKAS